MQNGLTSVACQRTKVMSIRNIPQLVVNFSLKGEICRGDMLCQRALLDISETAGGSRVQPPVLIVIIVIAPTCHRNPRL